MIARLAAINLLLLVSCGLLWWLDGSLERQRAERRTAESTFHALAADGVTADRVARIELQLPGASQAQVYVRRADGWHLPADHDAFALSQPIDGLLGTLLGSRGTVVGRMPDDAGHFGLRQGRLEVTLVDALGVRLVRAFVGRSVPGQRHDECYLAADGQEPILHANANPWNVLSAEPGSRADPPFLDRQVIPVALGRGMPVMITFDGDAAPTPREWVRKEVPPERARQLGKQGPRFELYGRTAEGETLLQSEVAFSYLGRITSLRFDEIVGGRQGHEALLAHPRLEVTLEYDGGSKDTLVLGAVDGRGQHAVSCTATEQVFLISREAADGLVGTGLALLQPAAAPASQPHVDGEGSTKQVPK